MLPTFRPEPCTAEATPSGFLPVLYQKDSDTTTSNVSAYASIKRIEQRNAHAGHVFLVSRDQFHLVDRSRRGNQGIDRGSGLAIAFTLTANASPFGCNFLLHRKNTPVIERQDLFLQPCLQAFCPCIIPAFDDALLNLTDCQERKIKRFLLLLAELLHDLFIRPFLHHFTDDTGVEKVIHRSMALPQSFRSRLMSNPSPSSNTGQAN